MDNSRNEKEKERKGKETRNFAREYGGKDRGRAGIAGYLCLFIYQQLLGYFILI